MSDDFDKVTPLGKVREIMGGAENVTPMRADPARLKPRALALLGHIRHARDVQPQLDRPYLVKGWLDAGALSVLYGPSNTGKSFLAVDVAHHVSKGRQWGRARVKAGRVLYIAAEGGSAFDNRVAALDDPEIWVVNCPMTLTGRDAQGGPLVEVVQHLEAVGGEPFALIVIDTMARVMGGSDENAAPDIADLVKNLDMIRQATGAHVMLVHHTGKDQSRGARGHSSLRAAIDTEIELSRDDFGLITARLTKQRDGATGREFGFTLRQVELGRDQDGDPVTTCLVEPAEPSEDGRAVVTEAARKALTDNPAREIERLKVPKGRQKPHTPWPDAAVEKWRAEASETAQLIFEIGVGSVQRPGDWPGFDWGDYDGDSLRLRQNKTDKPLVLPCTIALRAALDAARAALPFAPLPNRPILTNQGGGRMTYRRMAEIMLKERQRLGLEAYDLHAMRYRGVMELAWAGCDDDEIMSYSGHATKAMVIKYAGEARQIMRARQAREKRQ